MYRLSKVQLASPLPRSAQDPQLASGPPILAFVGGAFSIPVPSGSTSLPMRPTRLYLGSGEMAQRFRHWVLLQRTWAQFTESIWWLTKPNNLLFFTFQDRVSLLSSDYHGTHPVDQASLIKLTEVQLPLPPEGWDQRPVHLGDQKKFKEADTLC